MSPAFWLGIDFGTSNTVALMRWPDGRVRPLLFDANPLLPSAVFAPTKPGAGSAVPGGDLVVGGDALHHARFDPAGLEPNPKQHIDEPTILLGEREVAVVDLFAAVLRYVFTEAKRVAGSDDFAVAIAHPAGWGTQRRAVLAEAARRAGLGGGGGPGSGGGGPGGAGGLGNGGGAGGFGNSGGQSGGASGGAQGGGVPALLVPEPVAAAHAFTAVLGQQVPDGKALVVYDLGAGTFDASVVVRRAAGFEAVAVDGLTDVGGLDIDATIVRWLAERYSPGDPELWTRLADAQDPESLRHRRMLWHDARVAKEMLSRAPAVVLQMPAPLNVDSQLTREEFEAAAKPLLERTVFTTAALIRQAGIAPEDVAGVLLVGGGSRIPLVATMLHRALNLAPTITEQPEIVVAEGCLLSLSAPPADGTGEGSPLWPAAAAAAAPYASMAAGPSSPAPSPPMAGSSPFGGAASLAGAGAGAVLAGGAAGAELAGGAAGAGAGAGALAGAGAAAGPAAAPIPQAAQAQPMQAPPADQAGTDPGIMWPDQGSPAAAGFTTPPAASTSAPPAGYIPTSYATPASGPPAGYVAPASAPPAGYGAPVSAPPVSGMPYSSPPVSGVPSSGAPVSGVPRGRVYQTGAYPTVQPPPNQPPPNQPPPFQPPAPMPAVPRYLPPPPAMAGAPVSPGPSSRVVPVYGDRPPAPPRKGGRNWLNALLVVIALLAVAGAGTTVYLVQLGKDKPSANSQSPGAGTSANPGDAGAGNAGSADPTGTGTEPTETTHAPATTATKTETVTAPDVSGQYVEYAKQQFRDKGFTGTFKITKRPTDDPDQVDHVLAQDPKANNRVAKNGTVTLTVGSEPVTPSSHPAPTTTGPRPTST